MALQYSGAKIMALRQNARNHADEVLEEYAAGQSVPVNMLRLAQEMGYTVYRATFKKETISGGVDFAPHGGGSIYVNKKDGPKRQRFTIAHELGHCVMHRQDHQNGIMERIDMLRDPNNHNDEEIEANEFAASILMPEGAVRAQWRKWGSTEILADIFKVSLSAMSYRLYNLGLKEDW